jgi:hypothetical protein
MAMEDLKEAQAANEEVTSDTLYSFIAQHKIANLITALNQPQNTEVSQMPVS